MRARALGLLLVPLLLSACSAGDPTVAPSVAAPATASAASTTAAAPTPAVSVVDGLTITTINLGPNAAPIDVVAAFGSIWVADHRVAAVSRIDPTTLEEVARITVGSGPGWFAVTDDAVWVTNQLGRGLTRMNPSTNSADVRVGDWATCGAPVVGGGFIWQVACDAGVVMKIDPATNTSTDIYLRELGLVVIADTVYAVQADAISTIDPATGAIDRVAEGAAGFPVAIDDRSIWLARDGEIARVALPDGEVLGRIAIGGEVTLTLAGDRAWVTQFGKATHEVDTFSYAAIRTLHLDRPSVAREIDGVVWVTSFHGNSLSWFTP
jgi:streptogramin lyase